MITDNVLRSELISVILFFGCIKKNMMNIKIIKRKFVY